MSGKLNVAFLWHMHQPYYRDPASRKYVLPWVRLHGLKGYTDMLTAVNRFGSVRTTFNFVPCLLRQLCDLVEGENDWYYDLSLKPAKDLEAVEKRLLLKHFFAANWDHMILTYPRYRHLLHKRGRQFSESGLDSLIKSFTAQEFLDLQVWFNLAWCGWAVQERFPFISELKRQDRDFSEADKLKLLNLQREILGKLIPTVKALWDEEKIEVSTTPFYHPILPLLIDSSSARISQPHDVLPKLVFQRPEDAREQLQRGREYVRELFGRSPDGLWPSEGSVSPAVCEMTQEVGFSWLASDENVLLATLGSAAREQALYQTYRSSQHGIQLLFRDKFLSDAIGFRYAHNTPTQAVDDLVTHLGNVASSFRKPEERIVAIILDGENAWEYFSDGGRAFFQELYERLSEHQRLQTTTVGAFTKEHPAKRTLPAIFPASWINGSFRIWIGDPVKNLAWERLAQAAATLESKIDGNGNAKAVALAREWLYIAEGSDWFWWYGEPNHTVFEEEFDQLFRYNLIHVYKELGLEAPDWLLKPLPNLQGRQDEEKLFPIHPTIDGKETWYYEWSGAKIIQADDFSGAMNFSSNLLERLYYGFSVEQFYLRLDPSQTFCESKDLRICAQFPSGNKTRLEITDLVKSQQPRLRLNRDSANNAALTAGYQTCVEIAIPLSCLGKAPGEILFSIHIYRDDIELERWPRENSYVCPWPTEAYLTANWIV